VVLVYLSFPMFRKLKPPKPLGFLAARDHIPVMDWLLAAAAGAAAVYYAVDYEGIAARQGAPNKIDLVFGVALVVLLLEAARRAFGLTLSAVAIVFVVYAFTSEWAPGVLAIKGASLSKLINQLTMSQEGIYGIPLRVSAQTVFLFVLLGAMLEKTGGGRYFVQLAFSLLGRFKGGPAKAAVCASGLTGMVSGSSIANVVTTGTFTIPLMKGAGYPPEKAAAVEVAASTNGQLMPPIMGAAAFIIAEYCNMPYLAVHHAHRGVQAGPAGPAEGATPGVLVHVPRRAALPGPAGRAGGDAAAGLQPAAVGVLGDRDAGGAGGGPGGRTGRARGRGCAGRTDPCRQAARRQPRRRRARDDGGRRRLRDGGDHRRHRQHGLRRANHRHR